MCGQPVPLPRVSAPLLCARPFCALTGCLHSAPPRTQLEAHLGIQAKGGAAQQPAQPPRRRVRAIPSRSASFLRLGSTSTSHSPLVHPTHSHHGPAPPLHASGSDAQGHLQLHSRWSARSHSTDVQHTSGGLGLSGPSPHASPSIQPCPPSPPLPLPPSNDSASAGGAMECSGGDEADATAAETAMALWPRIESSYPQLELEYFKRRAAAQRPAAASGGSGGGQLAPPQQQQGGQAVTQGAAGPSSATGSRAERPAASAAGAATSAAALPAHVATFADDLSSYVRYDRLEVMASLQQGDPRTASQQVGGAALSKSKNRICAYHSCYARVRTCSHLRTYVHAHTHTFHPPGSACAWAQAGATYPATRSQTRTSLCACISTQAAHPSRCCPTP